MEATVKNGRGRGVCRNGMKTGTHEMENKAIFCNNFLSSGYVVCSVTHFPHYLHEMFSKIFICSYVTNLDLFIRLLEMHSLASKQHRIKIKSG